MTLRSIVPLILPWLLVGCDMPEGADADDVAVVEEHDYDNDDVEFRNALCALLGVPNFSGNLMLDGTIPVPHHASMAHTSPDALYDHGGCDDHYVVQANIGVLTSFENLEVFTSFGQALNYNQCVFSAVEYSLLVYKNGSWAVQGGDHYVSGQWSGTHCFVNSKFSIPDGENVDKVRVVARASFLDGTGEHKAKVRVDVVSWSPV